MIPSDSTTDRAAEREAMLEALLAAVGELHRIDPGEAAVRRALGQIAQVIGAETAYLLAREDGATGTFRPVVTWAPEGTAPRPTGPAEMPLDGRTAEDSEAAGRQAQILRDVPPPWGAPDGGTLLLCPVRLEGTLWGWIGFRRAAPSGPNWTDETAQRLRPVARHVAVWLQRRGDTEAAAWGAQRDGARSGTSLPTVQANQLQRRVESQRALVEASKLLVAPDPFAMEELLQIVGETTGADYAYLLSIHPSMDEAPPPLTQRSTDGQPPIDMEAYAHHEWHAAGSDPKRRSDPPGWAEGDGAAPDGSTFAVPLLSAQNLLFGYLGIEFEDETSPLNNEDVRLLNVLGDMLCTYLQRRITDRALRKSERRYRYFVGTISEAIWRVDFDPPIALDADAAHIRAAMAQQGTMAECNDELARLFGVEGADQLMGWSVERLIEFTGERLVRDLMEADFRLQGQEYVTYTDRRESRHFIVNTSGVVEDGMLFSLWGSTTEVTERVRLERRMVSALEQQQQRIGRNLHDSVGQLLTGVRMLAQNLEERHFGAGAPGHEQIQKIVSYADEAARHVNNLQRGLMPVQMEQAGLAQALQELAGNTDVLPEVDCIYVHDGTTDVRDHEKKLQLYRIAQEATNNALKHGHPSYIKIALKSDGAALRLEVEDDGTGFDVDAVTEGSLGLHSMDYRARSIGAALDVHSEQGHGTAVRCTLQGAGRDNSQKYTD